MTQPARFPSKEIAAAAAAKRSLAGPVWISGVAAAFEKVSPGWYVGWPKNIRKALMTEAEAA